MPFTPVVLALLGPARLLLGAVAVVGAVIAFLSVLFRGDLRGGQKLLWGVLVVFVPFAWLVYFILGRRRTAAILR